MIFIYRNHLISKNCEIRSSVPLRKQVPYYNFLWLQQKSLSNRTNSIVSNTSTGSLNDEEDEEYDDAEEDEDILDGSSHFD